MKHLRLLPLSLALGLALNGAAHAQSLVDLFGAAKQYDATYRGAQAQYEANKAKADQVISAIFPTINLQTNATRTHANANSTSSTAAAIASNIKAAPVRRGWCSPI